MAGVKGKSGGIRPNSGGARVNSGGARVGAGRKPKSAANESASKAKAPPVEIPNSDMLKMLQDVALGRIEATTIQVRAAIAAVQYTHTKKGDGGKKEEKDDAAKKAGAGKFGTSAPPKLIVSNSR